MATFIAVIHNRAIEICVGVLIAASTSKTSTQVAPMNSADVLGDLRILRMRLGRAY